VSAAEFLRKADAALVSAKREMAAGDAEAAANRLYYAMFHAARAALLSAGQSAEAQRLRSRGDYGAETPEMADVGTYVAKADEFVAAIKGVLSGNPRRRS
jgi:uncharacterized protein (UPF0332 family)